MNRIYLDHSATTPVDSRVIEAMLPYFDNIFGNPSSPHSEGEEAHMALEDARAKVADLIGADANEIYFTSGGTESDNLAIKGVAYKNRSKGKHIITSAIEHPAVLRTCEYLESSGFEATYLPVDSEGLVDLSDVEAAIRDDTILISVMHANNEIGTVQPISEIGKMAHERGIYFHTDAVQSAGKIEIDVKKLDADLLSMSSHKIHGPKGVGALYIKKGTKVEALSHGGSHERKMRAGTENVSGIVGFAQACKLCNDNLAKEAAHMTKLRDRLIDGLLEIEDSYLNGSRTQRLPNNANIRFSYIEGEGMLLLLDMKGIAVSTGSACSSASLEPSHVLTAIGLKPEESHGSLRFSLGRENTQEEIDYVIEVMPEIVEKLRAMSPIKKNWSR